MKLILGSRSELRRRILEGLRGHINGHELCFMVPEIDEDSFKYTDAEELTLKLAKAKAESLLPRICEPAILITAGRAVLFNGGVVRKPSNEEGATNLLRSYGSRVVSIVTTLLLLDTNRGRSTNGIDIGSLFFNPIPEDVIVAYTKTGDPFVRAGGFSYGHELLNPYIVKMRGGAGSLEGLPEELLLRLLSQVEC